MSDTLVSSDPASRDADGGISHSFMEKRRLEILALGDAAAFAEVRKTKRHTVDISEPQKAANATIPDFTEDPIVGGSLPNVETRRVNVAPTPVIANARIIEPAVVHDVPCTRPVMADGITANVVVSALVTSSEPGYAQYLAVTRNANSAAKSEGDMGATIASVVGRDGVEVTEAAIPAMAIRIVHAKLLAARGATASAHPIARPMDVVVSDIRDFSKAIAAHPENMSVFIPSAMTPQVAGALLTLLVQGGAGAFTWRYRATGEGAKGHADLMPAAARVALPGGLQRIMAVAENAQRLSRMIVGGSALTFPALCNLEKFYRRFWGNEIFDDAHRTAMAMMCVYLDPNEAAGEAGNNLQLLQTTQTNAAGIDLRAQCFRVWDGRGGQHAANAIDNIALPHVNERIPLSEAAFLVRFLREHADAWPDSMENVPAGNQTIERSSVIATMYGVTIEMVPARTTRGKAVENLEFEFAWIDIREICAHAEFPMDRVLFWFAQNILMAGEETGVLFESTPDSIEPDGTYAYRSVYGCYDNGAFVVPRLDIGAMLGVLATIMRPAKRSITPDLLDNTKLEVRTRFYGSRLHLAHMFTLADLDVWPMDLAMGVAEHPAIMHKLPIRMQNFFMHSGALTIEMYPRHNYEVFENGFLLGHARSITPFVGFSVDGTWHPTAALNIDMADIANDYDALEAAVRAELSNGGRVDFNFNASVVNPSFAVLKSLEGYINPLPFARRVMGRRGETPTQIEAINAVSSLASGHAVTTYITNTY